MTDQNGTTQEGNKNTSDMSACMEMMGEMFLQGECDCDCGEVMSQAKFDGDIPEEWRSMMVQMMEACFRDGASRENVSKEAVYEG